MHAKSFANETIHVNATNNQKLLQILNQFTNCKIYRYARVVSESAYRQN